MDTGAVIRGKYRLEEEIGRGGMGIVFRARHLGFDEECAVKLLINAQPELARSLAAEAKLLRQIRHPNIVRVDDIDRAETGQPFIAMELVRGASVRSRVNAGKMPWREALQIARGVCNALEFAHGKGIIHRDIKPQNILLEEHTGSVKLIDFGIAKVREDAAVSISGLITAPTGYFIGTLEYASPEQAMGMSGRELDGRTDIYSLGLVIYQLVTGVLPFQSGSVQQRLLQRLTAQPRYPRELVPELPPRVEELILKALATGREARFASAADMQSTIDMVYEPDVCVNLPGASGDVLSPVVAQQPLKGKITFDKGRTEEFVDVYTGLSGDRRLVFAYSSSLDDPLIYTDRLARVELSRIAEVVFLAVTDDEKKQIRSKDKFAFEYGHSRVRKARITLRGNKTIDGVWMDTHAVFGAGSDAAVNALIGPEGQKYDLEGLDIVKVLFR